MSWYRQYKISAIQQDLFEKDEVEEEKSVEEKKNDIYYLGGQTDATKVSYVWFKIGNKYYAYILSFADWIKKVSSIAKHSSGRALAWAKKHASSEYEVTAEFPLPGSIIREIE